MRILIHYLPSASWVIKQVLMTLRHACQYSDPLCRCPAHKQYQPEYHTYFIAIITPPLHMYSNDFKSAESCLCGIHWSSYCHCGFIFIHFVINTHCGTMSCKLYWILPSMCSFTWQICWVLLPVCVLRCVLSSWEVQHVRATMSACLLNHHQLTNSISVSRICFTCIKMFCAAIDTELKEWYFVIL